MLNKAIRGGLSGLGCLVAMGASPLLAQEVCSIVQYQECHADGECFDAPADPTDAPAFITIDRAAEVVHATEERFSDRSSRILSVVEEAGRIMLTGIEDGRAWGITIVEETGAMSLAISDPDEAILIFGRCIPMDDLDQ